MLQRSSAPAIGMLSCKRCGAAIENDFIFRDPARLPLPSDFLTHG